MAVRARNAPNAKSRSAPRFRQNASATHSQETSSLPDDRLVTASGTKPPGRDARADRKTADPNSVGSKQDPENDPAVGAYLDLLDDDMRSHPERIKPLDSALFARVDALFGDIEIDVDLARPLSPEDE